MLLSLSGYLLVLNWRGPAGAARTTWTAWDEHIPFAPAWVWVYFLPYLIGPILVGILSRDTFAWFIRRGLVVVFVTLVIFVVYPTQTVRPAAKDLGEGLTARLYQNMVTVDDPPANAAPSFHVSLTCLLAWALARDFPRWRLAAFAGAGVVWLATLLTWQHHLIDVGTGILLATVVATPWRKGLSR
jgi:hypothetical protein